MIHQTWCVARPQVQAGGHWDNPAQNSRVQGGKRQRIRDTTWPCLYWIWRSCLLRFCVWMSERGTASLSPKVYRLGRTHMSQQVLKGQYILKPCDDSCFLSKMKERVISFSWDIQQQCLFPESMNEILTKLQLIWCMGCLFKQQLLFRYSALNQI